MVQERKGVRRRDSLGGTKRGTEEVKARRRWVGRVEDKDKNANARCFPSGESTSLVILKEQHKFKHPTLKCDLLGDVFRLDMLFLICNEDLITIYLPLLF